jgi:hypothetical protein
MGDGFVELKCCGESVGFVNARPFTAAASLRFAAIQQTLGNAWTEDAEAKAIVADPASYGPPPDGTPILFSCERCGAHFTWIGGVPMQAGSS